MQQLVDEINERARAKFGTGRVADYIPALAEQNANKFGIAVCTNDGQVYAAGDARDAFSVQSIAKVFLLTLSLRVYQDTLWERVGLNPSGMPFNSLTQLEAERGKPRNPFINAGAIVVADRLVSAFATPSKHIRDVARRLSGNESILIDARVLESEWQHRSRNAAMAYLMKAFGNIDNDVDQVLHSYFSCCSLAMSCVDLAIALNYLAADGHAQAMGEQFIAADLARRINSIMFTCGMYDAAGDFAYRVGLPAKSGVGGGIIAIVPGKMTVCAWSPALDENGNSVAAQYALELLANEMGCEFGR
ncbi:glutaminase [Litchfieldella anticariensis FP35 = DSM 16096]|uniref:Glutaminase n=1 Tax=Litchfieldella anticariensis (strain DSM 16096 / CECT 5854 / CIP 108499 / LMG 22089 / FP35) TaxID=1121939 RepID=S2KK26_LITA3|nr:glutaminase B [Halomonas anticariensis]EPC00783.1 glutaminase [Halomonas anticariensis FP35 = DSM 16096]